MNLGQALNRFRLRVTSPLAEVALATAAAMTFGSSVMALTGSDAAAGMLWVAAFYGVIGVTSVVERLRYGAFADQLSRDQMSRVRNAKARSEFRRRRAQARKAWRNNHVGVAC